MMTDREKLIALIKEGECGALALEDCSYCKYDGEDDCSYQLLADVLLSDGVVVREKGEWLPCFIYTHHDVSSCLQGHDGWECSICGESFDTRYDYCVCGADMRKGENDG
jgi:hypothetical protein